MSARIEGRSEALLRELKRLSHSRPEQRAEESSASGYPGAAGALSNAPQQPPPQRPGTRLRAQPLVTKHELPTGASREYALVVSMPTTARVAFGGDQHMLAEGG